jgi:hypothetical protein
MIDDELEQRLRAHYRAIDPRPVSVALTQRIDAAIERKSRRPVVTIRSQRVFATLLAAVLIVAVGFGLRPGGFLTGPGASSSPTTVPASASPSPSTSSGAPSPKISASPSATSIPSSGPTASASAVPVAAWRTLDLKAIAAGPVQPGPVVPWSGGVVALGQPGDQGSLTAWTSSDGRSWTPLTGTFGSAGSVEGAPCGDTVIVATQAADGATTVWHSTDGATWTSSSAPDLSFGDHTNMAGNQLGAVAIVAPRSVAFTSDCVTWSTVPLPGGPSSKVTGVAVSNGRFVAVGDDGAATISPVAWSSEDGLHWTRATTPSNRNGGFQSVAGAADGLVAISSTPTVPSVTTFWSSPDGAAWTVNTAPPLGVVTQGEGVGDVNGLFSGDGSRLLAYGTGPTGGATEYWTSLDGTHWTKLALTGDMTAAAAGEVTPFLLPDGVLFGGATGSSLGTPQP